MKKSEKVRQSVILAAGFGQRMGSPDHGVPKPLMEVAGRPLIQYALAQSAGAGCEQAVVVTGNGREQIEERLADLRLPLAVRVVENPDFHLPNGVSLLAAEPYIEGPFYLQMSDHVFGRPVLSVLGPYVPGRLRLLVDRRPAYSDDDDATKVGLGKGGLIRSIGKELARWDAVDTGCFLLDGRVFKALREVGKPEERSVTAGMARLIELGILGAAELEGVTWVDVDTPRDRKMAEKLFGPRGPYGG